MRVTDFVVRYNRPLNYQNNLIKVAPADNVALPDMFPGQFVHILVENSPGVFLRRPISIHFVDKEKNEIWLLIGQIGEGTRKICETAVGGVLNLIFPLGKPFTIQHTKGKFLLVGGGVGMAPMLFLGKKLCSKGLSPDFLLGGRSEKDILQLNEFEKYGTVYCTTEDGSLGEKGFITQHSVLQKKKYDFIYTCGPKPMMISVALYAHKNGTGCEASLENLMACGFGACLCCVEKTTRGNLCTCTEGPVFNINELKWID